MKVAAIVVVVLAVAAAAVDATKRSADADMQEFVSFMKTFNKNYTAGEFAQRFANFQASRARVAEKNAKSKQVGGAMYGITKFSDMTVEEFKSTVLMKRPIKQDEERVAGVETLVPRLAATDLPASFDWRPLGAVTAVKDQEQCGSCWAFSATETIESAQIVAKKATNTSMLLAPQQIVDCDTVDQGCNGGNTNTAYEYVIRAGGMENETEYPYQGQDGQCQFQAGDVVAKISSFKYATSLYNEETLKTNLVSWQPISVCVDASSWQDYQSGVMTREECAWINVLDHCVQLVGYETNAPKPYWIVRNSWNTNWGIEGYIWLAYGDDVCGISHDATVPVV